MLQIQLVLGFTALFLSAFPFESGAQANNGIGDLVWMDLDADGVQDPGEPGKAGVTVSLQDCAGNVLSTTTTDNTGRYEFDNLAAGHYQLRFVAPTGFILSPPKQSTGGRDSNPAPATGLTGCMPVANAQVRLGIDAGLIGQSAGTGTGQLGDLVWADLDADGVQDPGEPGKAGVTVSLQDCAGNVLSTTTTDNTGRYEFDNLAAGHYQLRFVAPTGFILSPPKQSTGGRDSNPAPATGLTGCMPISNGQVKPGVDAGLTGSGTQPGTNVLMIILDDANDYAGLGGHPQAKTPNIDALAQQAILFTNAHVASPACNPSRTSFMTGISPARSGVTHNGGGQLREKLPHAQTLNQVFDAAGYYTRGYGRIYYTWREEIEHWDEFRNGDHSQHLPGNTRLINPRLNGLNLTKAFDWGPLDVADSEMPDYQNASRVINFLQQHPGNSQPFFLAWGTHQPHMPWYCPRSHTNDIATNTGSIILPPINPGDLDDVGQVARRWVSTIDDEGPIQAAGLHKDAIHNYLACLSFVDGQVGRVLNALDQSEFAHNTIVVLLSDHGWHLGTKFTWRKFKLWEEDTRVPFMIRIPGQSPRRVDQAVNVPAIFPTLIELAGITGPTYAANDTLYKIDYRSLVPLITGSQWSGEAVTFNKSGNVSIRGNRYRFTRYGNGFVELYDHAVDTHEWNNIADVPQLQSLIGARNSEAQRYLNANHQPL